MNTASFRDGPQRLYRLTLLMNLTAVHGTLKRTGPRKEKLNPIVDVSCERGQEMAVFPGLASCWHLQKDTHRAAEEALPWGT